MPVYIFDGWRLDTGRRTLTRPDGTRVSLTTREFDMMVAFCKSPQTTMPRASLMIDSNDEAQVIAKRTVDVMIIRLRQKIETNCKMPEIIRTIRHLGYYFAPPVTIE